MLALADNRSWRFKTLGIGCVLIPQTGGDSVGSSSSCGVKGDDGAPGT